MPDTEKLTINMAVVDLGKIDVLTDEGIYTSRTDFIRTAIRSQLERHAPELGHAVTRAAYVVGAVIYDRAALEAVKAKGEHLDISVVGMLGIGADVTPGLARDTISAVKVRGVFRASHEIKAALADRTS